jgi:hypothetical protein
MLLVRNAPSSTHYCSVTGSASPDLATLVLPKMRRLGIIRTNDIALNVCSSTNPNKVTLVLIMLNHLIFGRTSVAKSLIVELEALCHGDISSNIRTKVPYHGVISSNSKNQFS